ncbi:tetratricopeptide repeat protein [Paraburkholderia acidisoli]|nr:tetratricopeptide repeat protein [Paraburkholderia acidisoli]
MHAHTLPNCLREAAAQYAAGQHAAALATLDPVLNALPDQAEAHELATRIHAGIAGPHTAAAAQRNAAAWLFRCERFAAAVHAFERARALEPGHVTTLANLGIALLRANRPQDAEAVLAHALILDPHHTSARLNHGTVLRALGRLTEAEAAYRDVLAREPAHVAAWNNLGLLLKDLNRLPESERACRRALALDDRHAEIHNNLGNALWQMGEIAASIDAYQRALALRPDYAAARTNLALPLLTRGDYANAWPLYESRHDPSMGAEGVARPPVPYPQWQGEPLAGKSVLVWPEQGLGDALQFVRYVPMLKALGAAHVSLACAPTLARLFETLDGVDRVIALDGTGHIERHDYWVLTMSLPLRFGTTVATIPARVPYLHVTYFMICI